MFALGMAAATALFLASHLTLGDGDGDPNKKLCRRFKIKRTLLYALYNVQHLLIFFIFLYIREIIIR